MKLLIALSLLTLCGASSVETSIWSRVTQKSAPSYDVVGLARSLIECVIRCKRSSTCAVAAYDVVSKMCALLSTATSLKPILEANDDIKIYIKTGIDQARTHARTHARQHEVIPIYFRCTEIFFCRTSEKKTLVRMLYERETLYKMCCVR